MLKAIPIILLTTAPATAACHKYSYWAYPHPQSCGLAHRAAESKVWFVELAPTPPAKPEEDKRTPAQIQDFAEHNAAMSAAHDELLERLNILLMDEGAKAPSSITTAPK